MFIDNRLRSICCAACLFLRMYCFRICPSFHRFVSQDIYCDMVGMGRKAVLSNVYVFICRVFLSVV